MINRFAFALLVFSGLLLTAPADEDKPDKPKPGGGPAEFTYLKYRLIGPAVGGRVARAAGVAGDPLTYYAAAASGGVWKSGDGGTTWKSVFDEQPTASIGSLAVAPSNPNVIYVGSGEANIRGNVAAGNGIYKSTDAGKTWKHVWRHEGQIGTLIVHPTNADVAFAAVLGDAFGPSAQRGVYRTTDGGITWKQVLHKDADTGASDVCFDPSNPTILFAGLWQARRKPWEFLSGGPGSGLYTSRDGGDTWKHFTGTGLPEGIWGKVGVAVAPSNNQRVYALIEAEKGGLFRSDDGGDNWTRVNGGNYLRQRAWYYSTLTIDPKNADIVWCPQVRMLKSIDGGKTFHNVKGFVHGDHHDLWIDPSNPQRMIDSNDGGVHVTTSGGHTWYAPPLPIAQFYHIACDNRTPYHVSGAMQDLGTASGPSNNLSVTGISNADWHEVGGGEAGFTVPDPADPDIVYAGEYGGYITRYDHRTRQARNMSIYPTQPSGHGAEDLRYRFQWTAPILISPHDSKTIYHAANVLFRSTDGGIHWTAVSPDLTRNDKSKQKWSGGPITGDNTGVEYYDTIFAIAESPKQKDLLWAGSDDGLVQVTTDGGTHWTNVTPNMHGLPEWATVACIEASPFDAGTAYVVADAHRLDDKHPYLFETTDFGKTWKSLTAKLPQDVYLHAVREDPKHQGLLFAGTERGVSFSIDGGATWRELKLNLPTVAVHDLVVKNDDLVVGTHGRSVWIFDDLTPIRQLTAPLADAAAHLFPVQPVTRYHYHGGYVKGMGANPPRGAVIQYHLKKKPKGDLIMEILDGQGGVVTKLSSKPEPEELAPDDPDGPDEPFKKPLLLKEVGVNRVTWDLRYQGAAIIKGAKFEGSLPQAGPLVNPGTYTLKLTVEGQTQNATVSVHPDPRIKAPDGDLAEQLKLALAVRDDISRISRLVNQVRSIRKQLLACNELLKEDSKAEPLIKKAKDLLAKLDAIEEKLHNPKAEVTYDILAQRGGAKLYSKFTSLYDWVQEGAGAPTQGMREVHAEIVRELEQDEKEVQALVSGDLAKLNTTARQLEVPNIIVPGQASGHR